jgi:hypothetical protein
MGHMNAGHPQNLRTPTNTGATTASVTRLPGGTYDPLRYRMRIETKLTEVPGTSDKLQP